MATVIHWNTPDTRKLAWKIELSCSHSVRRSYQGFGPVVYPKVGDEIACPECAKGTPRATSGCAGCRFGHGWASGLHNMMHALNEGAVRSVSFDGANGVRVTR
jgi:hypothetical protein